MGSLPHEETRMSEGKICPFMSKPVEITPYNSGDDTPKLQPMHQMYHAICHEDECAAWGLNGTRGMGKGCRLIP